MNPSGTDASTSQHNFLSTLAKGLTSDQHLLVARRVVWNDKTTGKEREAFPAEMWREQYLDGPWYFSTGASDSKKSRTNEHMVAVRAIVLDDVGSKVDPDKIKAAPTWVIETSAGNYQWGFLLKGWTEDIEGGDALFAGLITAGLQDPGVKRCCRLFRIPGSINDKPGRNGFVSVLHDFTPERVYTLKSLAAALGVTPGQAHKPRVDTGERPAAGKTDHTFEWLRAKGMVQCRMSGGWWQIDCPFKDEHSDGRDDARYLPVSESMSGRSMVECWHGHGQDDKAAYTARFKKWLADEGAPPMEEANPAGDLDAFKSFLRGLPNGKPKPQVRKQQPAEPADLFTHGTLATALGEVPKNILPRADRTDKGYARVQPCTYSNVEAGLGHLGVQVRLNLMNGKTSYILPERIDMGRFGAKTQTEVDGMIDSALCDIFNTAGLRSKKELRDCLARIANSLYWHPVKDWIESVEWDGVDRFEALAASVTTDTPDLFRRYFRRWALQGIEAACGWEVRRKEQKALCLVLVGNQGVGKTRWLMALAPGFSAEGKHLALDGNGARDSKHEALQAWITELGELDSTLGKSANGSLKAFVSTDTDEYRLPFASDWLTRPRCTNFCGSVNDEKFLRDATGSRRWAAVKVSRCDPAHGIDMQQFWAQVRTWWRDGEQWWLSDDEVSQQTASNDRFNIADGISEQIEDEIAKREDREVYTLECSLSQTQVCQLLNIKHDHPGTMARAGDALRKHQGDSRNLRKRGAATSRGWVWWLTGGEAESLGVKPLLTVPK